MTPTDPGTYLEQVGGLATGVILGIILVWGIWQIIKRR